MDSGVVTATVSLTGAVMIVAFRFLCGTETGRPRTAVCPALRAGAAVVRPVQ